MKAPKGEAEPIRGFEYEPTPGYTPLYKLRTDASGEPITLQCGDARKIIEAKQALRKPHNSVPPSGSVMTPYPSKNKGSCSHEEQEESSQLATWKSSGERALSPARSLRRAKIGTRHFHGDQRQPYVRATKAHRNTDQDFGHTISKCSELKKVPHELVNYGLLNCLLRKVRRSQSLESRGRKDNDADRNMETIAIIIGSIVENGLNIAH
ncbi:LOW QUALITY PROTEIN: hypothetical protein Cgig2_025756 [Carnegiea gigantea]|uniref:Uncharacterized protein n=1 Tax=Carnegiea gigantea TaxID=171969 RepID=A0A9Q1GRN5_9CARY|nr:LOW QUALITY PROTEIN: hypothetical protein Cgig2_025756 [Carnegiea gigantea]